MEISHLPGIKFFNKNLLSSIKQRKNTKVISIIQKVSNFCNLVDPKGRTLLHYAAEYNNPTISQYLINNGCEIDVVDFHNNTPLMIAVHERNELIVQTLLGANATIGDFQSGKKHIMITPMISKSPEDLKVLGMLFKKLTADCLDNNNVAHKLFELHFTLPVVIFLKNIEITQQMLDLGRSIDDVLPETNETALHIAVLLLDIKHVKFLVNSGANINTVDVNNCTPLHRLDMLSDMHVHVKLEILSFLLGHGATLRETVEFGELFRTKILSQGDSRTLRVLMPYFNLFDKDDSGRTPLHGFMMNENPGIVEVLKYQNYDINARDNHGWTPLDIASIYERLEMVQFLLENGANTNNITNTGFSMPSFIIARSFRSNKTKRIVELFLQYGADAQMVIRGNTKKENNFFLVKPVLAHLAMTESLGEFLNELVHEEIEASDICKHYFKSCKLQLEKMKSMIMHESVTLHILLFERCEKKIAMYARNEDFISNYELFVKDNKYDIDSYYISTLELRVGKTINLVQMKEKAANIICEIIGLPSSMIGTIGYNIIKYLQLEDMDNLVLY